MHICSPRWRWVKRSQVIRTARERLWLGYRCDSRSAIFCFRFISSHYGLVTPNRTISSVSTLAQAMASCLTTPRHCLELLLTSVRWHSPGSNFTRSVPNLNSYRLFGDTASGITSTSLREQWFNSMSVRQWVGAHRSLESRSHDDVIKWKHFPRYWPFVRGIHRSPVNSPHKGQWRGALIFSLISAGKTIETLVIWAAIALIMTSLQCMTSASTGGI